MQVSLLCKLHLAGEILYFFTACARKLGKRLTGCHGRTHACGQGPGAQKRPVKQQPAGGAPLDGFRLLGGPPRLPHVTVTSVQQFWGLESVQGEQRESCDPGHLSAQVPALCACSIPSSDVCGLFVFATVAAVRVLDRGRSSVQPGRSLKAASLPSVNLQVPKY